MTDECIQIMGGMGFMKVQDGSLPGAATIGLGEVGRHISAGAYDLSSPVLGAWGRTRAPRSSYLPDL